MEHLKVSQTDTGVHLEGFPDAIKVIKIDGPLAKRLSDLALHKADLEFADSCLDSINQVPPEPFSIREGLWRSAIIHFIKCFGDGVRFQLAPRAIYKQEPPISLEAFNYFKDLRNKYFVHDENAYSQCIPGAILNNGKKTYKIEKIVCLGAIAGTLTEANYGNLKLLIQKAYSWVTAEFDKLCNQLTAELEKETYENLISRESIKLRIPTIDEISQKRKNH